MRSIAIKIIFVVVLSAALYGVLVWKQKVENPGQTKSEVRDSEDRNLKSIYVVHDYKDGEHILTGAIPLPTPCHNLETDVEIMESSPEQVNINFNVSDAAEGTMCIQVIDERPFEVKFRASENPILRAKVNNEPYMLLVDDRSGKLKQ